MGQSDVEFLPLTMRARLMFANAKKAKTPSGRRALALRMYGWTLYTTRIEMLAAGRNCKFREGPLEVPPLYVGVRSFWKLYRVSVSWQKSWMASPRFRTADFKCRFSRTKLYWVRYTMPSRVSIQYYDIL